jgi:hypothetical protein
MKAGIDVYAHEDTWWAVNDKLNNRYAHRKKTFEHEQEFIIDDYWKVLPFAAVHDVTCSGFVISEPFAGGNRLCFLTDTAYCRYRFPKINIFMIEANFSEAILQKNVELGFIDKYRASRVFKSHMSIERVIDFLKANDLSCCREIKLLHLSNGNSSENLFKRMVQEATGIMTTVEAE